MKTAMLTLKEEIGERILMAPQHYYRLIMIIDPKRQFMQEMLLNDLSEIGVGYLNLGFSLSQKLLELSERQRSLRLRVVMDQLLSSFEEKPIFLDHIEILFTPQLNQDPLRLLQGLSRNRIILTLWCGQEENGYLTYAFPGHPEYRRYSTQDLTLLTLPDYVI